MSSGETRKGNLIYHNEMRLDLHAAVFDAVAF